MSSVAKWITLAILSTCFCIWFLTPLRSPSRSQMLGEYQVDLPWGNALLQLNADGTFRELVRIHSGESHEVKGKWSLSADWQSSLSLQPYWQFSQDEPGNKVEVASLPVESWWVRDVRIEFGDFDSYIKLLKQ